MFAHDALPEASIDVDRRQGTAVAERLGGDVVGRPGSGSLGMTWRAA